MSKIIVVMESPSDEQKLNPAISLLEDFKSKISYKRKSAAEAGATCPDTLEIEVHCISTYHNFTDLDSFVERINDSSQRNIINAIIVSASISATLPGDIAARTILPVIGVPLSGETPISELATYSDLSGFVSLFSMVKMPTGIPVATVGANSIENAAYLALEIAALKNDSIKNLLEDVRAKKRQINILKNQELSKKYGTAI